MTYEEGKALKESMLNYYECLRSGATKEEYKGETLMSYEVVGMINDCIDNALEKEDKYRWHDLRENPDDLPKEYRTVFTQSVVKEYDLGWVENNEDGTHSWYGCEYTPIAWKYIEPFDEVEK